MTTTTETTAVAVAGGLADLVSVRLRLSYGTIF